MANFKKKHKKELAKYYYFCSYYRNSSILLMLAEMLIKIKRSSKERLQISRDWPKTTAVFTVKEN